MPTTGAGRVRSSGDRKPVPSGPCRTGSGVRIWAVPKKPPPGANTPPSWATIVYGGRLASTTGGGGGGTAICGGSGARHGAVAATGTVTRMPAAAALTAALLASAGAAATSAKAAFMAAVVAGVSHTTGAALVKHRPAGSACQVTLALGQLPVAHAWLPALEMALAPMDSDGWAAGSMPERSRIPLESTISLVARTWLVAASLTVTVSESKSPVVGSRLASRMAT